MWNDRGKPLDANADAPGLDTLLDAGPGADSSAAGSGDRGSSSGSDRISARRSGSRSRLRACCIWVNSLALQAGYRTSDLSLVYPTARGSGPLPSFIGATLLLESGRRCYPRLA